MAATFVRSPWQAPSANAGDGQAREEVQFRVGSETCGAWWYPAHGEGPHPVIVMAHGLGATRELGLDPYARRFRDAGISALVFDYRHYGASTGAPRELLSIGRQLADFRAAIAFARSLPNVDATRVAIWGSSFGGGHVMSLAAEDLGLCAAVSQVPFSSGLASTLRIPLLTAIRLTLAGIVDLTKAALGLAPNYVLLLGTPGQVALMSSPDSLPGYRKLVAREVETQRRWHNRVCARIGLSIPFYAPSRKLARARVPVFVAVAEQDSIAPSGPTIRAAQRSAAVELHRYPLGHFDYYPIADTETPERFEQVVADELAFLRKQLFRGVG